MEIKKGDNKELFEALVFAQKATTKYNDSFHENLKYLQIENSRLVATDGHRIHITLIDLPDGYYLMMKKGTTITMELSNKKIHYPDINTILPNQYSHFVKVDRKKLIHGLKQAKVILSKDYKGIVINFNGRLEIKAINPDIGDMETEIETDKCVNPELQVGMNCDYILDALNGLAGHDVTLGLQGDNLCPIMFFGENGSALIMPMRI